jgi:CheY-like chemotaxis protein
LDESVKLLRPVLPSSIDLSCHIDNELGLASVDPVQVNQLIMNLCINARDAMNETGLIEINATMTQLQSAVCNSCHQQISGDFVEISVTDNGPGISTEAIKRVFEPFFTTKDVGKGTGMGLSMVHGIMHHIGGHILVESIYGEGAKFRLLFPVVRVRPSESATFGENSNVDVNGNGQTIVVVDDEEVISLFMKELLSGHGYQVVRFADSLAALEYFKQHQQEVDLVITDQTMPNMTGIEMAQAMLDLREELPIILSTGYSALVDEESSKSEGIRAFLQKPFDSNKLLVTVKTLLST